MITVTATESKKQKTNRLCYLFMIFLTGCLVGWIYEEIFYWVTGGLLRNRGILYGPWLPIYGIGAHGEEDEPEYRPQRLSASAPPVPG